MRIPYGVKCNINGELCKVTRIDVECQQVYLKKDDEHGGTYSIARGDVIKPYLRSMSSMTDEEDLEFIGIGLLVVNYGTNGNAKHKCKLSIPEIDWLNTHHFDYRGLIEKGLALEAPEGMYK